jgi:hypothetical protein
MTLVSTAYQGERKPSALLEHQIDLRGRCEGRTPITIRVARQHVSDACADGTRWAEDGDGLRVAFMGSKGGTSWPEAARAESVNTVEDAAVAWGAGRWNL